MPKKYSTYWYQEGPEFKTAFLYNLRDNDVQSGRKIERGEIVQGAVGLVAAETTAFGWMGKILTFNPNRDCVWHGFDLPCMALPSVPAGKVPAKLLRECNYIVAAVASDGVKALADKLKVPCVRTPDGVDVINLEIARFTGQAEARRATLI